MALTLRLQRHGRKKRPFYKLVAADSRKPRDGSFSEGLGYYDPNAEPSIIEFKLDRVSKLYAQGAKVSDPVRNLLKKKGFEFNRKLPAQ